MFTETRFEFMFSETLFNFMFTGLMSFGNPPNYKNIKINVLNTYARQLFVYNQSSLHALRPCLRGVALTV